MTDFRTAIDETYSDYADLLLRPLTINPLPTTAKGPKSVTGTPVGGGSPVADVISKPGDRTRPNGEVYIPRIVKGYGPDRTDVEIVENAYANGLRVLLYGPPGTGKTALAEAAFGEDLVTIAGASETEAADFDGSWVQRTDGNYEWVDGPLVTAMILGHKLLIDEIALIDQGVLAHVYSTIDGRGELHLTANPARGTIKAAPGFDVIGAFNPDVPGAIVSDALLSRFSIHVEVTTDWDLLKRLGVSVDAITLARNLHHKQNNHEIVAAPQTRELLTYEKIRSVFGDDFALANLVAQSRPEDRAIVIDVVQAIYSRRVKALKIGNTSSDAVPF
jgi:MoxR-like ATPase